MSVRSSESWPTWTDDGGDIMSQYILIRAHNRPELAGRFCTLLSPAQRVRAYTAPQCRIEIDGQWYFAPPQWLLKVDPVGRPAVTLAEPA